MHVWPNGTYIVQPGTVWVLSTYNKYSYTTGQFQQRVPLPVAMWKPGAPDSVPLNFNGPGTLQVGHERAAILVCYEQLLVWPVLTSMTERPTVLVGLANDYWAKDTIIPAIQHSCLEAWARLFDIPP